MQIVEVVLHFAVGQFAVDQVAGAVVAVAAFDSISRCYCIFSCLGLRQIVECGNLPFQMA